MDRGIRSKKKTRMVSPAAYSLGVGRLRIGDQCLRRLPAVNRRDTAPARRGPHARQRDVHRHHHIACAEALMPPALPHLHRCITLRQSRAEAEQGIGFRFSALLAVTIEALVDVEARQRRTSAGRSPGSSSSSNASSFSPRPSSAPFPPCSTPCWHRTPSAQPGRPQPLPDAFQQPASTDNNDAGDRPLRRSPSGTCQQLYKLFQQLSAIQRRLTFCIASYNGFWRATSETCTCGAPRKVCW